MTQLELAQRVALRPETICRLEKQRQAAGIRAAQKLARALRVSPEQLTSGVDVAQIAPEVKRARQQQSERICTDCGQTKPVDAFVRIRACQEGWYGRCRACRARRARERYQSDTQERERQKARVKRNRAKKLAPLAA